ncbi:uncharacterized protein Tco025E_02568 [Trypanosoma conorhini]|uniref:Uncharacterized protein n=1 Tax=Trypanosoma conorhini TaxID=83891 RepID=A0A3S5IU24_9TRYP|nr:uncharacterized protein Tco025E_02568 [Trypanosoma conorhini]RNF24317.1 hypothetical protein Tco025E_02568 [Trypanosoma conorhini]
MFEKQAPRHFLRETRSQHLHREENMRRRLELMRRESAKPPVMHFGTASSLRRSSSKSVSPAPRFVSLDASAEAEAEAEKKSSRSAPMVNSEPRSRPLSRERSRRLPLPPGAKPTTRRPSLPRSKSYRGVSATASRVTSPVPAARTAEPHPARPPLKRSRSTSQTEKAIKLARMSHPRTHDAAMEERRAPFMCSGSPSKRTASPLKRSASRTPPPLPLPTMRADEDESAMLGFTPPNTHVDKAEEVAFSISPVAPPQTETVEGGEVGKVSQEAAEEEEEGEPAPFRVSEFRLPRAPQHRSSDAASHIVLTPPHLPPFPHTAQGEELRATEDVVRRDEDPAATLGDSAESEVVSDVSSAAAVSLSHHSREREMASGVRSATPVDTSERADEEEKEEEEEEEETRKKLCEDVAVATAPGVRAASQGEASQPASCAVAAFVAMDVAVAKEPVAFSAQSSHAYECSSTTTESPERNVEASEARKLDFDSHDASQKEDKEQVPLARLTAEEVAPPVPPPHAESESFSQPFYDCRSFPSTPGVELPEAYRLLEATRLEMAVPSNFPRAPRRLGDRRSEEGRGSLVLVTGELPLAHTPRIQEPRTPPPSEHPKRCSPAPKPQLNAPDSNLSATPPLANNTTLLSLERSPLPRPVTLRSQVRTPIQLSQAKVSLTLSQSPREDHRKPSPLTSLAETFNFNEGLAADAPECEKRCPADERAVEATPPCTSARCRSRSTGSRRSMVERLMECCSPDARKEVEHLVTGEAATQTPSLHRGSGQLSEALTDTSCISQRVAARPRRHYYDYTYWERYLRDATRQSAKKGRRRGAKKANKAAKKSASGVVLVGSEAHVRRLSVTEQDVVVPLAESTAAAKSTVASSSGRATEAVQRNVDRRPSQSHSGHKKKVASKRASLRKAMSRRNREQIVRRRRRSSGRQNRRK